MHFKWIGVKFTRLRMNLKGCKRWKFQQSYNRVFAPHFATPIWKPAKTQFSTPKHDEHSHEVPGGSRIDFDIFEFDQKCLKTIQHPMLLFSLSVAPVHIILVFWFYFSNSKLHWDEFWSACQFQYHAPPQKYSKKPTSSFKIYDQIVRRLFYRKWFHNEVCSACH
jgi:hypothetical protein